MKTFSFEGCKAGDVIIDQFKNKYTILTTFELGFIYDIPENKARAGIILSYEKAKYLGWTFEEVEEEDRGFQSFFLFQFGEKIVQQFPELKDHFWNQTSRWVKFAEEIRKILKS